MAILPTLGTGILVNSGQALEAGCPFSLLMAYWFIFALIPGVGMAVAESADRMPVNGGTIVNRSYLRRYSLTMLVPFETTNSIASPGLFAPHPQLISAIFGLGMLPEEMFKKLQALCILLITTVSLLVLSVFLSVRQASGTATVFIRSVTVGIPVLFLFSRSLCTVGPGPYTHGISSIQIWRAVHRERVGCELIPAGSGGLDDLGVHGRGQFGPTVLWALAEFAPTWPK